MRKVLYLFLVLLVLALAATIAAWFIGSASLIDAPEITPPVSQARINNVSKDQPFSIQESSTQQQILFGDLHTHSSYSMDAAIFDTSLVKGTGYTTPADACDYARYCSALDFWSPNDHAEGLAPWQWQVTKDAVRQCNAATTPASPDMVTFLGWEWSQGGGGDVTHYGHKNVIFLEQDEEKVPPRAIGSGKKNIWRQIGTSSPIVRGFAIMAASGFKFAGFDSLAHHLQSVYETPDCRAEDLDSRTADCHEVADTPNELFSKLEQGGYEALVIPHGLAWGTTNPVGADFQQQMDQLNSKYQRLLEVYSGHGNSEVYRDVSITMAGDEQCPEPANGYTPCCWQAGTIIQQRCELNGGDDCEARADNTRAMYMQALKPISQLSPHRTVVPDTTADDWGQCDQLTDAFQPAHNYQPKQSAQYILSLNNDGQRFKPGFIGSSDNHLARPGNSYKETDRYYTTDTKTRDEEQAVSNVKADQPKKPGKLRFSFTDQEDAANAFYFTGGLVAVHSADRSREAIWNALQQRAVYGTSGPRIKLWFDLLDEQNTAHTMGSEVSVASAPKFKVSAVGSLKQKPGCPEFVHNALGDDRVQSLCRNECQNPSNEAWRIERLEVVRVLPQTAGKQPTAELIQDPWQVFECKGQELSCTAEFSDPEFLQTGRDAAYYVRAIQEATDTIQGDPFHCEYNDRGQCVTSNYCQGGSVDDDCLSKAEHRAWSSPIYVSVANQGLQ
ncbi:MAG: DUF3604 domain-containing protein [Pseudomonadales bacterium]